MATGRSAAVTRRGSTLEARRGIRRRRLIALARHENWRDSVSDQPLSGMALSGLPVPGLHRIEGIVTLRRRGDAAALVGTNITLDLEDGRSLALTVADAHGPCARRRPRPRSRLLVLLKATPTCSFATPISPRISRAFELVRTTVFIDEQHVPLKLEFDDRDAVCRHVLALERRRADRHGAARPRLRRQGRPRGGARKRTAATASRAH